MSRVAIVLVKSLDQGIRIAVDQANSKEILSFIHQDDRYRKKFRHICNIILEGLRNTELYDKEEPNHKCKGVRAMKFFKGQENARIYCKEVNIAGVCIIVMAGVLKQKKQTRLTHRELTIIERVGGYEYQEFV